MFCVTCCGNKINKIINIFFLNIEKKNQKKNLKNKFKKKNLQKNYKNNFTKKISPKNFFNIFPP